MLILALSIFLILKSLEENVVYFKSPSEIKIDAEMDKKKMRVGGMVKKNSIKIESQDVKFVITDFKNEIEVKYIGILPDLFKEEQGVVVQGNIDRMKVMRANEVLAKHDENYMPPEIEAIQSIKEKINDI